MYRQIDSISLPHNQIVIQSLKTFILYIMDRIKGVDFIPLYILNNYFINSFVVLYVT